MRVDAKNHDIQAEVYQRQNENHREKGIVQRAREGDPRNS